MSKVHLIGIGGAGMSGIARILIARGDVVSGSDAMESATVDSLRELGARIAIGHDATNLGDAQTVVISTAVRDSNPELVAARDKGLRVLHRAEQLAALTAGSRLIAVAGTHGKSTTTSLMTVGLQRCGLDPSYAIGAELTEAGANAHNGEGDFFVLEADESDGSFLRFAPELAIVTNIEADHLDHYGTLEAVQRSFDDFAARIVPGGTLVACADDPGTRALAESARAKGLAVRTYGLDLNADLVISEIRHVGGLELTYSIGGASRVCALRLSGEHNALNAAAALLAADSLGVDFDAFATGVSHFGGVRRRFEHKGVAQGVTVIDDYAHHPTEVRANLMAAREIAAGRRVIAVFQPHLFSRTRLFAEEFGAALALADAVIVMAIYAAREEPEAGVTSELIATAARAAGNTAVSYLSDDSDVAARVASMVRKGDLVITLGAGSVTEQGPLILDAIDSRHT